MVPQPHPHDTTDAPSGKHNAYYHPTTREQFLQELVRAQRDADRIARKRRLARKRQRREHLYPWLLAIAAGVCVLIGLIGWGAVW